MAKHSSRKGLKDRVRSTPLLQTVSYIGNYNIPTSIQLLQYNNKQLITKTIQKDELLSDEVKKDSISWFKIVGFSDVTRIGNICKKFGIQRFDIKDMFSNLQVTKVVTYEHATFVLMSSCSLDEDGRVDVDQVAFIMGRNYVISMQEKPSPIFDDIVTALNESRAQLRDKGADYLLYILLNSVHAGYIDTIGKITEKLDEVEDSLISQDDTNRDIMRLFRTRRNDCAVVRRSVTSLREELNNLLHNSNRLLQENSVMYFNDFDDRLRTTLEEVEILNQSINSLTELYFNNNNLKMNEIIKRLTIVSTIFIPLTFMVGIWGMNFKFMPELEWEYGYLVSWVIFFFIAAIAIIFLKRKKWL